jgi:hypothetical protein
MATKFPVSGTQMVRPVLSFGIFAGGLILFILSVVFELVDVVNKERRGDHNDKA